MRRAAVLVLAVAVVGCGGHNRARPGPIAHQEPGHRVAIPPAERDGFWVKLYLSPDERWWLGQWSGECEVQTAYFVPVADGKPVPVFARGVESEALGWSGRLARVLAPHGLCADTHGPAGIYLVDPRTHHATLARLLKARP